MFYINGLKLYLVKFLEMTVKEFLQTILLCLVIFIFGFIMMFRLPGLLLQLVIVMSLIYGLNR